VGTVPAIRAAEPRCEVHPHVCGDSLVTPVKIFSSAGSSPRVWGQYIMEAFFQFLNRFIPTCVGTVKDHSRSTALRTVHPHVCGDSWHVDGRGGLVEGSSPRVWGQCGNTGLTAQPHRFIPTCVGTVAYIRVSESNLRFIPTCVGTVGLIGITRSFAPGSSPRVWGQSPGRWPAGTAVRFIPTCVGTVQQGASM